jgi:hypothetical protein
MSNDELLLPMHPKLSGGEMIRVVGGNGKTMLVPVTALVDGTAITALRDDILVLTAHILALEARPIVSTAGLASQASVTALVANLTALIENVTALTDRVEALEIKLKKDK